MSGTTTEIIPAGLAAESYVKVGDYGDEVGDCVDLGYLKDGVNIDVEVGRHEVFVDQVLGAVDMPPNKESVVVKFSIAQASLEKMAIALGYPSSAVASGVFTFGNAPDSAKKTLFFFSPGPNGGTRTHHFFKAVSGKSSPAYQKDKEVVVDVEFNCLADTTKSSGGAFFEWTDTGADSTAPTVAMTTPASGGSRTAGSSETVLMTITEAGQMDEGSIRYGDTVQVLKEGAGSAPALVAGSIAYDSSAKTITFTPSSVWTAGNYMVMVSTGLRDAALNNLASTYVGYFTVSE